MKYSALDFLACPLDKNFPLKLLAPEVRPAPASPGGTYDCQAYCGYRGEPVVEGSPRPYCEQCHLLTVETGSLTCEHCGGVYPIKYGIPRLVSPDLLSQEYAPADTTGGPEDFVHTAKRAEMRARDAVEKEQALATFTSRRHQFLKGIELQAVYRCLDPQGEDIVLDAGAGRGVSSIPLSRRCRYVVSTDISFESLRAFKELIYGISTSYFEGYEEFPEAKLCLVQADMCHLPFRQGFHFDRAISVQVVSHIPRPGERERSLAQVGDYLKSGGIFVLTVANDSLPLRLARPLTGTPRESLLGDGKAVGYYYKFRSHEFRALLEKYFVVERLFGLHVSAYALASISPAFAGLVDKAIGRLPPLSRLVGDLLLAQCRKR